MKTTARAIRLSEITSALSYALDLTEGQPLGHAVRSCLIGMRIGDRLGLPAESRRALYYALLLKDAGCSANASPLFEILGTDEIRAKRDVKTTDWTRVGWDGVKYAWTHVATDRPIFERIAALARVARRRERDACEIVRIRCERGAAIARRMGFPEAVAEAIHGLDEQWGGAGHPEGRRGESIPLLARIMNLAQVLEVFHAQRGPEAAVDVARDRSGRWFDPALVDAAVDLAASGSLWAELESGQALERVVERAPEDDASAVDEAGLDEICLAFAEVIDAKSPFTFRHSNGVAQACVAMARRLGMDEGETTFLRRAALLHDIGKLSVPNSVLEKPGKLTAHEWEIVRKHPYYTQEILSRVPGFGELGEIAASHHEKLDGSGYHRGLGAERLPLPARVLAVADVYDALHAERPYREAMPRPAVFETISRDVPAKLDADCFAALREADLYGELDG